MRRNTDASRHGRWTILAALLLIGALLLTGCGVSKTREGGSISGESYTRGKLSDGVYTNTWAGFEITVPEDLPDAPNLYESAENATTECGLYLRDPGGTRALYVVFEKLPHDYSDEEYLDAVMKGLESTMSQSDLSLELSDSYEKAIVAGSEYLRADCVYSLGMIEVYQSYYTRILDGYAISIAATAGSMEENEALIKLIKAL